MLILCMNLLYSLLHGQTNNLLQGVVTDGNQVPLPGASVFLYPLNQGAIANAEGRFVINNLPQGTYVIEISFIGFATLKDTIGISGIKTYNARLSANTLSLQEVVVAGNYHEMRKKNEPLNIEIVNEDFVRQNLGGSLMSSLERLPGVTTIEIGAGQSKPVIRGLGFNRVVVMENSIKHEAQQWGADHGLEIDQYAVDDIEVIKGPASLMYGSDAIGGVIDLKNRTLPDANTFGGSIDLTGRTTNDLLGGSLSLFIRKNAIFANARVTLLDYGDYKVPTDSVDIYSYRAPLYNHHLRNTAGNEKNLHLSLGIIKNRFQNRSYISSVNTENGFFANAHGMEPRNVDTELHDRSSRDIQYPYHVVHHLKLINSSMFQWWLFVLDLDLGVQRNFRQEWSQYVSHGYMPDVFPDTLDVNPDLERQFEKLVYSGNLKLSYRLSDKTQFTAGISGEFQDNRIDGTGFIIPAYEQINSGLFMFGKHHISGNSMVQLGIRYDFGHIQTLAYHDWFPSPVIINGDTVMQYLQRAEDLERNFSNVTWSVGYTYNSLNWSVKANAGKSYRMPIAKELAANGVNYHHFSYEVGDPGLAAEVSYQLDGGLEYGSRRLAIGATPFLNYFPNYIYLNPTSEHDRLYGNGNQVYVYTQSRVFRFGAELHAHYELLRFLQLGVIGEYVYSEQLSGEKKGFSLPFSPPASALVNLKFHRPVIACIENAYLSIDYRITAAQNNIVPPEEPTRGYQLINIRLGGGLKLGNTRLDISLQVQNLLNSKYFNHTSYYRLINVPEPGRNFVVNISIPFSGIMKQE